MKWDTNYRRTDIKGLGSNVNQLVKDEETELKTIEGVQEFIQKEIRSCDNFESEIKREFIEIKDMQNNLNAILTRFNSITKIVRSKERLAKQVIEEILKPKVDVDIEKCANYFLLIRQLDQELNPMLESMDRELYKFILPEYHKIYEQSEDLRDQIKKISGEAGKVHAEFKYLCNNLANSNIELNNVNNRLIELEQERKRREPMHQTAGFKLG